MRTKVTFDPDTAALIRRRMRERGIPFKQALDEVIRAEPMSTAVRCSGQPPHRWACL